MAEFTIERGFSCLQAYYSFPSSNLLLLRVKHAKIILTTVRSPRNEIRWVFVRQKEVRIYKEETAHMVSYLIHGITHLGTKLQRNIQDALPQIQEPSYTKFPLVPRNFRPAPWMVHARGMFWTPVSVDI